VTWLIATGAVVLLAGLATVGASRRLPATRAALFGATAGIIFGYQAAVMKVFVTVVPNGLGSILASWSTYALIASALGGFYFLQTALQIGVLAPAIATSNAASPITSVVLGRVIFLEVPQRTTAGKIVSAASAALLVVGLILLRGEGSRQVRGSFRD
jgi:hypothetical protein